MKKGKSGNRGSAAKGKGAPKDVDEYLAGISEPARSALNKIRAAIRSAATGTSRGFGAVRVRRQRPTVIGGKKNLDIVEKLDGIVHYLDTMRDIAVDVYDYEENAVFDLSDTDNR